MSGTTLSATATGNGDVVGPSSSTDNAIARYDLATGKLIQDSSASVDDNGSVSANTIKLSATPTVGAPIIGEIYYNSAEGGLPEYKVSTASSITLGAEFYCIVVNKTGVQIND